MEATEGEEQDPMKRRLAVLENQVAMMKLALKPIASFIEHMNTGGLASLVEKTVEDKVRDIGVDVAVIKVSMKGIRGDIAQIKIMVNPDVIEKADVPPSPEPLPKEVTDKIGPKPV